MKFFLTALILLCCVCPARARDIFFYSDLWCPYACFPGNRAGYMVELVKAVYRARGDAPRYEIIGWGEAIRLVSTGKGDALLGCTKEETPNLVFPKHEIGMSDTVFFTSTDSKWAYKGLDSLLDGKLGASFGYDYGDTLNHYVLEHPGRVLLAKSNDPLKELLRNLNTGAVDFIVGDSDAVMYKAGSLGLAGRIKRVGEYGKPGPVYVAFNPKDEDAKALADAFDAALPKLRASGRLAKILAKYGLKDWKAPSP